MAALLTPPAIPELIGRIMAIPDGARYKCLTRLRRLGLIAPESSHLPGGLDCHPLVWEHMADLLQKQFPAAWQEGNLRLYEHYKGIAKEYPDTIEEMAPLFYACTHGCRAGRKQEALEEVYWKRICRGREAFVISKLGAFGSALAALANFFDSLWDRPATGLTEDDQASVLNNAGFGLRALGQLAEAKEPMQAGLEIRIRQEKWRSADIVASNLSELFLVLGEVVQAVEYGQQSEELADRSGDAFERLTKRTTHAASLHQAGRLAAAEELFRQAEDLQREDQPWHPLLYSMQGYHYCDLLLDIDRPSEARERAEKTIERISQGWRATGRNGMTPGSCIRILFRMSISRTRKNESTWRVPRRSLPN
jgi:tetratricopeptide (TPR) repeat protein